MQHDIIDNRERKLAASVKPLLSESEKAKFAVGYFFTPARDAKLQRLIKWLDDESLLRQHKLLIFTQFSDTGGYLYKNLHKKYRNLEFADSNRTDLASVIRRFAPIANNVPAGKISEPINVLISTDVLSEGLNLQDAAYILNYDLHWNPVRLIQRFGRIDRLNTLHREIYAFNFLPDPKLEQHLGIEQTLRERISEIHESIGEDSPILEPDDLSLIASNDEQMANLPMKMVNGV
jgi:superfamily II DNA/RNA helicase